MKSIFPYQSTLNSEIKVALLSPVYTFFSGTTSLFIKAGITEWLKPNVKVSIDSVFQETLEKTLNLFKHEILKVYQA